MKRRILSAVGTLAAAAALGLSAVAPAWADETIEEAPEVSWNGEDGTWSKELDVPMFSVKDATPCDSYDGTAMVRNGGTRDARLTVTFKNVQIAPGREASDPFFKQIKLKTHVATGGVHDFIPDLVGRDVVLFDEVVPAKHEVAVTATYDWTYGYACIAGDPDNAGNDKPGPWMDFQVEAKMSYVVGDPTPTPTTPTPTETDPTPTDTSPTPTETDPTPTDTSPTPTETTTPPPSSSEAPPTSTTAPPSSPPASSAPIEVGGKSTTRAPGGDPGQPDDPGTPNAGGSLPSTGASGPVLGLGLSALVLIALGLPLALRRRQRRSHS